MLDPNLALAPGTDRRSLCQQGGARVGIGVDISILKLLMGAHGMEANAGKTMSLKPPIRQQQDYPAATVADFSTAVLTNGAVPSRKRSLHLERAHF